MGIQLQLILTACIVNFGLTSTQSDNQVVEQAVPSNAEDQSDEVKENFQNLFNSIAKNDKKKRETLQQILRQEDAKERQAFDAMKVELQLTQNKNAYKKMHFYRQINGENIRATKRETDLEFSLFRERDKDQTLRLVPCCVRIEVFNDFGLTSIIFGSTASAEGFTYDQDKLRKMFRKYYPEPKNLTTVTWLDVESLTPESLQRICDEVFVQFRDKEFAALHKKFEYVPVDPSDLQIMRVIRACPFLFSGATPEGLCVAICVYDKYKFYIAPAGNKHVFRLRQNEHGQMALHSGLYPVVIR